MSENEEPDWLAELAKQLFEGAERIVRDARRGKTTGTGLVPPSQQRVVRAVDAAMRELVPVRQPAIHPMIFPTTVIGSSSLTAAATITVSGSIALPPMHFSGQATVEHSPSGKSEPSIGQILALVLVAIATWRLLVVPEQDRAAVDHYLTVIGFGLAIAVLIWNKQNKPK